MFDGQYLTQLTTIKNSLPTSILPSIPHYVFISPCIKKKTFIIISSYQKIKLKLKKNNRITKKLMFFLATKLTNYRLHIVRITQNKQWFSFIVVPQDRKIFIRLIRILMEEHSTSQIMIS